MLKRFSCIILAAEALLRTGNHLTYYRPSSLPKHGTDSALTFSSTKACIRQLCYPNILIYIFIFLFVPFFCFCFIVVLPYYAGASIPQTTKALFPQLSPFPPFPIPPFSLPFPLPPSPFPPFLPRGSPIETSYEVWGVL